VTIFQLIQKSQLRGVEVFTVQLSKHLEQLGHTVYLICLYSGDTDLDYSNTIKLNRSLHKRFYDISGWKQLAKLIKEKKPDLIQANAADTLKFAVFSKILFQWKRPLIYRNASKIGDYIHGKIQLFFNRFLMKNLDYVIPVSQSSGQDFLDNFHNALNKIQIIPIGLEKKEIMNFPDDLIQMKEKSPLILHVGGFSFEKNHTGLISIFEKIRAKYPLAQLVLVGNGKLVINIKQLVQEHGLSDSVHFLGYRNDVLEIMKGVDVFVLPSIIEGLPGVILEAMYCKTPVVAYNVGGISEVVKPNETGWLVDKNDEAGFVLAIEAALDKDKTELITDNAYKMVCSNYMNDEIAKQFEAVYKKVCQK
jgi:glycosyltransferase involved in cell wall biosynthesis